MQATEIDKKNTLKNALQHFPRGHIAAAGALAITLTSLMSLLPSEEVRATRYQQSIDLSLPASVVSAAEIDEFNIDQDFLEEEAPWKELVVKSGDNLSLIFQRAGLDERAVYELLQGCEQAKALTRILPGNRLAFQIGNDGTLQQLRYIENKLRSQVFSRTDEGFIAQPEVREPDRQPAYREATINSSLFLAGQEARLDSKLIMEMASIFGWDIDFALDIRQGDSFKVLFEELFLDGEKIGNGAILAVEFTNQGITHSAVRYTNENGISHYFTPDGDSLRKEFIRTPVELARISSHFNLRRRHPVLNTIRAHKGTDYAAPRGTPVKATGDGKVIFAGRKGGYGNAVIIQHGQTYQTLYAHLHNFRRGIRSGSRVKQGQVIGYVGSTGLATGPHLHYEFYVNGSVRNPVRVKLPKANSIAKVELTRFKEQTGQLIAQLTKFHSATQIALADNLETSVN